MATNGSTIIWPCRHMRLTCVAERRATDGAAYRTNHLRRCLLIPIVGLPSLRLFSFALSPKQEEDQSCESNTAKKETDDHTSNCANIRLCLRSNDRRGVSGRSC